MSSTGKEILDRIDRRLSETGQTASAVCKESGALDAIKNMRRAILAGRDYRPGVQTLEKLAPVLGTTVEWLVSGEPSAALISESEDFARDHLQIRAWRLIQNRSTEELRRIIATIEAAFPRAEGGDQ